MRPLSSSPVTSLSDRIVPGCREAFDLIRRVAPDVGAECIASTEQDATYNMPLRQPDGREILFTLRVVEKDGVLRVRELEPEHLPASCPNLHIESDALWCVGWLKEVDLRVTDEPTAREWWGRVSLFMARAHRSAKKRKWLYEQRAHGDAAKHENEAEEAADAIGEEVRADLDAGRLELIGPLNRPKGKLLLRVLRNLRIFLASWLTPEAAEPDDLSLIHRRKPCICGNGSLRRHRSLKQCEDHAKQSRRLIWGMHMKQVEEQRFWDSYKRRGEQCCNRMDECPLRDAA